MNAAAHQYRGNQQLAYTNNSPDTLTKIFYHLYFNAFKPNSMMDVRSRSIADPDRRVGSRIAKLKPEEQGNIQVNSLKMEGQTAKFETNETILEVTLPKPILPGKTVNLVMEWDAQVPVQIRRSGRDNAEGIAYSMAQWYPKLCEYDYQGWHTNPYIAREFYGVWGDFDVTINIDKNYVVAAGGYLQNPQEIGYGYEKEGSTVKRADGPTLSWHFKTPNVHDFVWTADPDYVHTKIKADDGTTMHFFWQKSEKADAAWAQLPTVMNRARTIMNKNCGKYPYQEYYFIQGGDGGMEYPLATLITGNQDIDGLAGVAIHEQLHSWYQMILGSNESLYPWMDEGFTSWSEDLVKNELMREGVLPGKAKDFPFNDAYNAYYKLQLSGKAEPLSIHADHYNTNRAYGVNAYSKGEIFLVQLSYVVGQDNFQRGMLRYFDTWKFKHPNANDFIRIMEKESGLELDWYKEDFVNTINFVDYGIRSVSSDDGGTAVVVEKAGLIAMPLDIEVTYSDGKKEIFYAPLESMRGEKPADNNLPRTVLPDHRWVDNYYFFTIPHPLKEVQRIEIDPSQRMTDIDIRDNFWKN